MSDNSRLRLLSGALALAISGCTTVFDVERVQRALMPDPAPQVPVVVFTPASDLPAPEGLRGAEGELRAVPLKWDPVLSGEVGGYLIERAREDGDSYVALPIVTGRFQTAVVDRGGADPDVATRLGGALEDGVLYRYRVRAFDGGGHLSERVSEEIRVRTAPPPAAPPRLRAYSHLPRRVALTWEPSVDAAATGYAVYRSPSASGPFDRVGETDGRHATVFVDANLGDLRLFYYRVQTRNAAGVEGPPSDEVRAVTKPEPLPPDGFRVEEQGLGRVRLSWEPNVEADLTGYRIERRRAGGPPEFVAQAGPEVTTVEDTAVGAGESLGYRIVALDRDGLESVAARLDDVAGTDYQLASRSVPEGVELSWQARRDEGFTGARIYRESALRRVEVGHSDSDRFLDADVEPGSEVRHVVVLERADGSLAPASRPVITRFDAAAPVDEPEAPVSEAGPAEDAAPEGAETSPPPEATADGAATTDTAPEAQQPDIAPSEAAPLDASEPPATGDERVDGPPPTP